VARDLLTEEFEMPTGPEYTPAMFYEAVTSTVALKVVGIESRAHLPDILRSARASAPEPLRVERCEPCAPEPLCPEPYAIRPEP
jgi:hypothetical protein